MTSIFWNIVWTIDICIWFTISPIFRILLTGKFIWITVIFFTDLTFWCILTEFIFFFLIVINYFFWYNTFFMVRNPRASFIIIIYITIIIVIIIMLFIGIFIFGRFIFSKLSSSFLWYRIYGSVAILGGVSSGIWCRCRSSIWVRNMAENLSFLKHSTTTI